MNEQRVLAILGDILHVAGTRHQTPRLDPDMLALRLQGLAAQVAQGDHLRLRLVVIAAEAVIALERHDGAQAPARGTA